VSLAKLKPLFWLVVPEGLVLAAAAILLHVSALRPSLPAFARFYPYVVFAGGALLGWRFQRSRLLFSLLVLALATAAIHRGQLTAQLTAFLMPVNLAGLALLAERGTFTPFGLLRLGAIGLQVVLVEMCVRTAPAATSALLNWALLPARFVPAAALGQPALLAFVVTFALVGAFLALAPNTITRGFLWAIAASWLAVAPLRPSAAAAVYLGTAGLILVVAVLETSYLLAYQDGLTGLPARRALTEALERLAGQYTVAMVDVDHFKQFNDRYGHDVGDQVLRMVAANLAEVEGGGRAYRYGGEEFSIVFPGKSLDDCLPHLERIREAVADARFTIRRRLRPRNKPDQPKPRKGRRSDATITVSIGVAARSQRNANPDQVIRAADRALYVAKQDGRNRVRS